MINHDKVEQRTPEWHQLRKGKITGTTLKALMGTPRMNEDAFYDILAQRLTVGLDDEDENPMERGVRLEDTAVAEFEFETGLKVDKTGFSERDDNPFIANSPDGWIGEDAGIEIKCPGGKNYVKMWLKNLVPDDYYWQMVQYFVVNEKLKKLYFVGYNPNIPVHPLHIIEVTRESVMEAIDDAEKMQDAFIKKVEATLSTLIKEL